MHDFRRDKGPVLLSGRLTEGVEKDRSLGLRESACLAWLAGTHLGSRKVSLSMFQNSILATGTHQGVAEIKKC